MTSYETRSQTLPEQVKEARRNLDEYKSAQLIGRDVVRPQVVQSYLPDGVTPTQHDIEGMFINLGTFQVWAAEGTVEFIPDNQTQPYAMLYAKFYVDGMMSPPPPPPDVNSFSYIIELMPEYLPDGRIVYRLEANSLNEDVPTIDRLWIKLFFYATDTGTLNISLNQGTVVTV